MDFDFNEDQRLLRSTAREFLRTHCPTSLVRASESESNSFSAQLWKEIAELGWPGVAVPEQFGGNGGGFLDLAVLVEELGRVMAPIPFVEHALVGLLIDELGSDQLKQRWLPALAAGGSIASVALVEPTFSLEPAGIQVSARQDGEELVLSGTKILVNSGDVANLLLVVARTGPGVENLGLLLVEATEPGIEQRPQRTVDGRSTSDVRFNSVRVSSDALLASGPDAFERLLLLGSALECFWMLGGAQEVLDRSIAYAKQRVQFDHPIGSFQAVQHRLANMAVQVDASRFLSYQAAWAVAEGLPAQKEVRIAKSWTSDGYRKVCFEAHQVHGAIGFTLEHDLQLFTRRSKLSELAYGDGPTQRRALAFVLGF